MLTLNELIESLLELKDKGYGELPVIYKAKDKWDSLHKLSVFPSKWLVDNIEDDYLLENFKFDENEELQPFEPNCILIN
jgi:hypothetical protein